MGKITETLHNGAQEQTIKQLSREEYSIAADFFTKLQTSGADPQIYAKFVQNISNGIAKYKKQLLTDSLMITPKSTVEAKNPIQGLELDKISHSIVVELRTANKITEAQSLFLHQISSLNAIQKNLDDLIVKGPYRQKAIIDLLILLTEIENYSEYIIKSAQNDSKSFRLFQLLNHYALSGLTGELWANLVEQHDLNKSLQELTTKLIHTIRPGKNGDDVVINFNSDKIDVLLNEARGGINDFFANHDKTVKDKIKKLSNEIIPSFLGIHFDDNGDKLKLDIVISELLDLETVGNFELTSEFIDTFLQACVKKGKDSFETVLTIEHEAITNRIIELRQLRDERIKYHKSSDNNIKLFVELKGKRANLLKILEAKKQLFENELNKKSALSVQDKSKLRKILKPMPKPVIDELERLLGKYVLPEDIYKQLHAVIKRVNIPALSESLIQNGLKEILKISNDRVDFYETLEKRVREQLTDVDKQIIDRINSENMWARSLLVNSALVTTIVQNGQHAGIYFGSVYNPTEFGISKKMPYKLASRLEVVDRIERESKRLNAIYHDGECLRQAGWSDAKNVEKAYLRLKDSIRKLDLLKTDIETNNLLLTLQTIETITVNRLSNTAKYNEDLYAKKGKISDAQRITRNQENITKAKGLFGKVYDFKAALIEQKRSKQAFIKVDELLNDFDKTTPEDICLELGKVESLVNLEDLQSTLKSLLLRLDLDDYNEEVINNYKLSENDEKRLAAQSISSIVNIVKRLELRTNSLLEQINKIKSELDNGNTEKGKGELKSNLVKLNNLLKAEKYHQALSSDVVNKSITSIQLELENYKQDGKYNYSEINKDLSRFKDFYSHNKDRRSLSIKDDSLINTPYNRNSGVMYWLLKKASFIIKTYNIFIKILKVLVSIVKFLFNIITWPFAELFKVVNRFFHRIYGEFSQTITDKIFEIENLKKESYVTEDEKLKLKNLTEKLKEIDSKVGRFSSDFYNLRMVEYVAIKDELEAIKKSIDRRIKKAKETLEQSIDCNNAPPSPTSSEGSESDKSLDPNVAEKFDVLISKYTSDISNSHELIKKDCHKEFIKQLNSQVKKLKLKDIIKTYKSRTDISEDQKTKISKLAEEFNRQLEALAAANIKVNNGQALNNDELNLIDALVNNLQVVENDLVAKKKFELILNPPSHKDIIALAKAKEGGAELVNDILKPGIIRDAAAAALEASKQEKTKDAHTELSIALAFIKSFAYHIKAKKEGVAPTLAAGIEACDKYFHDAGKAGRDYAFDKVCEYLIKLTEEKYGQVIALAKSHNQPVLHPKLLKDIEKRINNLEQGKNRYLKILNELRNKKYTDNSAVELYKINEKLGGLDQIVKDVITPPTAEEKYNRALKKLGVNIGLNIFDSGLLTQAVADSGKVVFDKLKEGKSEQIPVVIFTSLINKLSAGLDPLQQGIFISVLAKSKDKLKAEIQNVLQAKYAVLLNKVEPQVNSDIEQLQGKIRTIFIEINNNPSHALKNECNNLLGLFANIDKFKNKKKELFEKIKNYTSKEVSIARIIELLRVEIEFSRLNTTYEQIIQQVPEEEKVSEKAIKVQDVILDILSHESLTLDGLLSKSLEDIKTAKAKEISKGKIFTESEAVKAFFTSLCSQIIKSNGGEEKVIEIFSSRMLGKVTTAVGKPFVHGMAHAAGAVQSAATSVSSVFGWLANSWNSEKHDKQIEAIRNGENPFVNDVNDVPPLDAARNIPGMGGLTALAAPQPGR